MKKEQMYLLLHVGVADKEDIGYIMYDARENIFAINSQLCELAEIYWAWKKRYKCMLIMFVGI